MGASVWRWWWVVMVGAGCGGDPGVGGAGSWVAEHDTVGDTVVVRTVDGSVWGGERTLVEEIRIGTLEGPAETTFGRVANVGVDASGRIHVVDAQARTVRVFDPAGTYLHSVGHEGEGPGELQQPSGIAFHPDGRLLVRDFGNTRINVYSADGEPLDTWRLPGGFSHGYPLHIDTAGHTYTAIIAEPLEPIGWRMGLLHFDPNGQIVDTVRIPEWDYEPPVLTAVRRSDGRESGWSRSNVPFTPTESWTLSPFGYFVGGVSTRYVVDLFRRDAPVLRIERLTPPVPVLPDEREDRERIMVNNMRRTESGWRWDGPGIPEHKPPFHSLQIDDDGRIWVALYQPGRLRDDAADIPDVEESGFARSRWIEPLVYDLFEPDGRFLGTLPMPDRFRPHFARGDLVWGVIRDELDVEYVVRYRLMRSP